LEKRRLNTTSSANRRNGQPKIAWVRLKQCLKKAVGLSKEDGKKMQISYISFLTLVFDTTCLFGVGLTCCKPKCMEATGLLGKAESRLGLQRKGLKKGVRIFQKDLRMTSEPQAVDPSVVVAVDNLVPYTVHISERPPP
jgi:hypothetical protein